MLETLGHWVKAKLALLCIGFIWGTFIVCFLPTHITAILTDRARAIQDYRLKWHYSILIAEDILTNTALGNYFRTTISSEVGNLARNGSETGHRVRLVIDKGFEVGVGQENHCEASIEKEDKHLLSPRRAIVGFCSFVVSVVWSIGLSYWLVAKVIL